MIYSEFQLKKQGTKLGGGSYAGKGVRVIFLPFWRILFLQKNIS